jgi:hypothetical protein
MNCAGLQLSITNSPADMQAESLSETIECALQLPTGPDGGCESPSASKVLD